VIIGSIRNSRSNDLDSLFSTTYRPISYIKGRPTPDVPYSQVLFLSNHMVSLLCTLYPSTLNLNKSINFIQKKSKVCQGWGLPNQLSPLSSALAALSIFVAKTDAKSAPSTYTPVGRTFEVLY